MKKLDFGQTVSVLANIGVIAGIVFLGIELRQNNSLLEAQTSLARFSVDRERRTRLLENRAGLLETMLKARNGEELNRTERAQLTAHWLDVLDSWLWQFREAQAGRIGQDLIDVTTWGNLWRQDEGFRTAYRNIFAQRDAEFDRYLEDNVIGFSDDRFWPQGAVG